MSLYIQFDEDGNQYQVASNLGWSDFGQWVDELDASTYPELVQLWEHGVSEDIQTCAKNLEEALSDDSPDDPNVKDVAESLLHALHANMDASAVLTTS